MLLLVPQILMLSLGTIYESGRTSDMYVIVDELGVTPHNGNNAVLVQVCAEHLFCLLLSITKERNITFVLTLFIHHN